ncbi:hypothetical protein V8C34DRAFT_193235 [Trichoderma compactum]
MDDGGFTLLRLPPSRHCHWATRQLVPRTTHRFHWLHHCNKLMVAPSSAAASIKDAAWKRWTLASHCRETEMAFPAPAKVRARVGAKAWAARGPSPRHARISLPMRFRPKDALAPLSQRLVKKPICGEWNK